MLLWIGLALAAGFVLSRTKGGGPNGGSTYVDKNGVTWTIYFDSMVGGKWHAMDKFGRYDQHNPPMSWDVTSSTGTKQQAIAAADFYAQEHKPAR